MIHIVVKKKKIIYNIMLDNSFYRLLTYIFGEYNIYTP